MSKRADQREQTRERIVEAAAEAFSERGYRGASTREIATRAETNQGLITYHFRSKDELWRAAADRIFGKLKSQLGKRLASLASLPPREEAREAIREYVRFAAAHPELFRFMVEEGKADSDRMEWLVDNHLRPLFENFLRLGESFSSQIGAAQLPHAYYVMAGAGSVIFALAPECRRLTGLDPTTSEAIDAHADFVARLLVP